MREKKKINRQELIKKKYYKVGVRGMGVAGGLSWGYYSVR